MFTQIAASGHVTTRYPAVTCPTPPVTGTNSITTFKKLSLFPPREEPPTEHLCCMCNNFRESGHMVLQVSLSYLFSRHKLLHPTM